MQTVFVHPFPPILLGILNPTMQRLPPLMSLNINKQCCTEAASHNGILIMLLKPTEAGKFGHFIISENDTHACMAYKFTCSIIPLQSTQVVLVDTLDHTPPLSTQLGAASIA